MAVPKFCIQTSSRNTTKTFRLFWDSAEITEMLKNAFVAGCAAAVRAVGLGSGKW